MSSPNPQQIPTPTPPNRKPSAKYSHKKNTAFKCLKPYSTNEHDKKAKNVITVNENDIVYFLKDKPLEDKYQDWYMVSKITQEEICKLEQDKEKAKEALNKSEYMLWMPRSYLEILPSEQQSFLKVPRRNSQGNSQTASHSHTSISITPNSFDDSNTNTNSLQTDMTSSTTVTNNMNSDYREKVDLAENACRKPPATLPRSIAFPNSYKNSIKSNYEASGGHQMPTTPDKPPLPQLSKMQSKLRRNLDEDFPTNNFIDNSQTNSQDHSYEEVQFQTQSNIANMSSRFMNIQRSNSPGPATSASPKTRENVRSFDRLSSQGSGYLVNPSDDSLDNLNEGYRDIWNGQNTNGQNTNLTTQSQPIQNHVQNQIFPNKFTDKNFKANTFIASGRKSQNNSQLPPVTKPRDREREPFEREHEHGPEVPNRNPAIRTTSRIYDKTPIDDVQLRKNGLIKWKPVILPNGKSARNQNWKCHYLNLTNRYERSYASTGTGKATKQLVFYKNEEKYNENNSYTCFILENCEVVWYNKNYKLKDFKSSKCNVFLISRENLGWGAGKLKFL